MIQSVGTIIKQRLISARWIIPFCLLSVSPFVFASSFTDVASLDATAIGELDCVIYPSAQADIGSGVPGVLVSIPVDRSDTVKKGQVVAVLESSAEQAAVALAKARAEAASEISFRRIGAEHSKRQLVRLEELYRNKSISNQDYDDRKTEALLGQVQLQQARENQSILELELARAQALLDRKTIRSPFDGVVLERVSVVGEFVNDQPIVRIAQLNPLHVETILPSEYIRDIKSGMTARVWSDHHPDRISTAHVDRVDSIIDVASATFGVRLNLANTNQDIAAGSRCRLEFTSSDDAQASSGVMSAETQYQTASAAASFYSEPVSYPEPVMGAALGDVLVNSEPLATNARVVNGAAQQGSGPLDSGHLDSGHCKSVGPYPDRESARIALNKLAHKDGELAVKEITTERQIGYLVMSYPLDTNKKINDYLAKINTLGITDFQLQKKNLPAKVSFGAFKNRSSAENLLSDLSAKNLTVRMLPWQRSMPAYFLVEQQDGAPGAC